MNFRSSRAFAEGRYRDGDVLAAEAYELGAYLGDTNETVDALRIMYTRLERGELPAAAAALERVEATTFGLTGPFRARMDVESGDLDAGRIALVAWMDPVFDQLPGLLHCFAAAQAVLIAGRLGDVERAIVLGEFLTLFRGELIGNDAWIYAAADHLVGLCAATAGRLDDAVELMRSGHAMHERLGLHARVAQSGLDLGRVLLERDQPGDREAGETHIRHTVAARRATRHEPVPRARPRRSSDRRARRLLGCRLPKVQRAVAQLVERQASKPGGRGFETFPPCSFAVESQELFSTSVSMPAPAA